MKLFELQAQKHEERTVAIQHEWYLELDGHEPVHYSCPERLADEFIDSLNKNPEVSYRTKIERIKSRTGQKPPTDTIVKMNDRYYQVLDDPNAEVKSYELHAPALEKQCVSQNKVDFHNSFIFLQVVNLFFFKICFKKSVT